MSSSSRPRRNVRQGPTRSPQAEDISRPSEETPAPSTEEATGPAKYTEEDLQRITKLCMESFLQAQGSRHEGPREGQLKARFPDLYYGKSHMECYHFCQQCEDHFDTAGATGSNRTPFAASFLRGRISFRWHQHKRRSQGEEVGPLSWIEFKAFLRKNLGDSRAFVDATWSRIKRDSQYQQEEVQDWASHLEHLQSILLEFDAEGAPEESDLIRFFREGLKPSIKAQMEQRGRELDSWEELVEKAIDAEAKASLQPQSILREMDQRCPHGNRPAHATVAKPQTSTRDPRDEPSEKPKTSGPKQPNSSRPENSEIADKKARREKKRQRRLDQARDRKGSESTPATGANTSNGTSRDVSQITCFNCNKKGHYASTCRESKKDASKN